MLLRTGTGTPETITTEQLGGYWTGIQCELGGSEGNFKLVSHGYIA